MVGPPRRGGRGTALSANAGVIWLVGPPGAGKTTLVASWLAARRGRQLWMQLDPGDGDVASFFHYLALLAAHRTPSDARPSGWWT